MGLLPADFEGDSHIYLPSDGVCPHSLFNLCGMLKGEGNHRGRILFLVDRLRLRDECGGWYLYRATE